MPTVASYKRKGYEGTDISLETSLFEYGLIWRQNKRTKKYHFIYGIEIDKDLSYSEFEDVNIGEDDFTDIIESSWFDVKAILSFCGILEKEEWLKLSIGHRISDCLHYYGYENIFGEA